GFDSLWLSDHLFLDIAKYGGSAEPQGVYEPIVTLAALARTVTRPRLGTLVACEALRPASVLAKALATLDRICGGRLDVGLGAGWYEPEYEAVGLAFPPPGERLARLAEAAAVVERCCDKVGRDPATVWRSLGLYALAGEDRADLKRRFERMRDVMPAGVVNGTLDEWRDGRLVGTIDELRAQRDEWEVLGVETLIVGAGPLPFSVT